MALPEQIRKQTEAVQELYKQLNDEENQGSQNDANGNVGAVKSSDHKKDGSKLRSTQRIAPRPNPLFGD